MSTPKILKKKILKIIDFYDLYLQYVTRDCLLVKAATFNPQLALKLFSLVVKRATLSKARTYLVRKQYVDFSAKL